MGRVRAGVGDWEAKKPGRLNTAKNIHRLQLTCSVRLCLEKITGTFSNSTPQEITTGDQVNSSMSGSAI
jgi:hypothetical protein